MRPKFRVLTVLAAALMGFITGGVLDNKPTDRGVLVPTGYQDVARDFPLPHHVPQYVGGLSFRFAMIHDVLHERFEKHGAAWYEHRNRLNQQRLETLTETDRSRWPIIDDLAAGMDRMGQPGEAVKLMRAKLQHQQEVGLTGRDLYTSYANLGTFLIHANARAAFAGNAQAITDFSEGVELVRNSVEVNPEAHFGRERWQANIAEFLLLAIQDPSLLRKYDCLGNSLDLAVRLTDDLPEYVWPNYYGYGRPHDQYFKNDVFYNFLQNAEKAVDPADPALWKELVAARKSITHIGAESDHLDTAKTEIDLPFERVAFDEPMLGIIGMWRQGGGANPHFALAIGETMLRVGQRYLAWSAFARAEMMADRYSSDPALQQFLRDHCRRRQNDIEVSFQQRPNGAYSIHPEMWDRNQELALASEKAEVPHAVATALQTAFKQELQSGLDFQKACHDFESRQLLSGVPLDAPDFYAKFHAEHPPIASPVGQEEYFRYANKSDARDREMRLAFAHAMFASGCGAMVPAACFLALNFLRRSRCSNNAA